VKIRATKDYQGPTAQRLIQSDGYVAIGDDGQGNKLWTCLDGTLARTYADLIKKSSERDYDQLQAEFEALDKFGRIYVVAFKSISGVDCNSLGGGFGSRDFLAKTEAQINARNQWRAARATLAHLEDIVCQNVVCNDLSLEIAGYAIGKQSKPRAIPAARELLRSSGGKLARLWGLTK
jgi:hypothetical protein